MKLYTEEQVEEMLIKARFHNMDDSEMFTNEYLISQHTPIELPSDEEIYGESILVNKNITIFNFDKVSFQYGAKWMRDKIQGGNNE